MGKRMRLRAHAIYIESPSQGFTPKKQHWHPPRLTVSPAHQTLLLRLVPRNPSERRTANEQRKGMGANRRLVETLQLGLVGPPVVDGETPSAQAAGRGRPPRALFCCPVPALFSRAMRPARRACDHPDRPRRQPTSCCAATRASNRRRGRLVHARCGQAILYGTLPHPAHATGGVSKGPTESVGNQPEMRTEASRQAPQNPRLKLPGQDSSCRNPCSGQGEETHQDSLAHALPTLSTADLDLAFILSVWDRLASEIKCRLVEMVQANLPPRGDVDEFDGIDERGD
jgi:hypothetical protein